VGNSKESSLVRWLAVLDRDRLAEILARRREALAPPPRSLGELAGRLQTRDSVTIGFQGLPLPAAQVVEVMQAIGGRSVARDQLAATFGRAADDPDLDATLRLLAERALVWPDPSGTALHMAGPLWSAFPHPLGLGPPVEQLLRRLPPARLAGIAASLGLSPGRGKNDALRAACRHLADPDQVRTLVEGAPKPARELVTAMAAGGPVALAPPGRSGRGPVTALDWTLERGLLVHDGWQHAVMPAEVARAVRGPQWRPRFDPDPPAPAPVSADPAAVSREAAAGAGTAVEQISALLDACSATPVAVLKTGGVGVRELRRLARIVGCGEREVRLWLELGYAAGLVAPVRDQVLPTEEYDAWQAAEPAARLAPLLRGWLRLPAAPLAVAGADSGPPSAALLRDANGLYAYDLRQEMLKAAAGLPGGHGLPDAEAVQALLFWRAPMLVGVVPDAGELIAGLWREACLLGVAAYGMLSPLGRALLADAADDTDTGDAGTAGAGAGAGTGHAGTGDAGTADAGTADAGAGGDLERVVARLLPAAVRTAMFQADLTAVVPGVPAADLAAVLDAAADRESRGGAVTWRFSPASVRRALDAGRDGDALLAELRGFAVGGTLPQPLAYLVGDVGRRHGAVRVRSVGCVLHAADPALLAEVAAVRALSPLRLTVLAPTVLLSEKPADETLAALRAAGYAPVGESADGLAQVELAPRHRAPAQRRRPATYGSAGPRQSRGPAGPQERRALAAALLAAHAAAAAGKPRAGGGPAAWPGADQPAFELDLEPPEEDYADDADDADDAPLTEVDGPEASVVRYAGHLTDLEQARLLAAIEDGSPIEISYTNAQGSGSTRVVEPIDLEDHLLVAWCRLRDEERAFALDRIQAVAPA
jgi:Helicase conserved C-terminal domain/WYL domain